MKIFYAFGIWFLSLQLYGQVNNYAVGDVVADFTVTDIYGNTYNLYNLTAQGKYVYLDFFYAACAACQSKISIFNEFWDKYGCGDNEIFCIAINQGVDDNATVAAFENQYGGSTHHAPAIASEGGAGSITTTFGVNVFSTFCLIAPDNKMINNNIHPVSAVKHFEDVFPAGFTPQPASCTNGFFENAALKKTKIFVDDNHHINVHFDQNATYELRIIDLTGKILFKKNFFAQQNIQLTDLQLNYGIYLIKINKQNSLTTYKILVD